MTPELYMAFGALAVLAVAAVVGTLIAGGCAASMGGMAGGLPPTWVPPPIPPPPEPPYRGDLSAWERANGTCPTCVTQR